ncbi:hypothetical protein AB0A63_17310 [Lentzea sp. NPDC042327]|uniref:hypothetical protein n=1 Tax=Lentzea sp. NPDC042327 TaxID=3154801 RepID=UPI0033E901FF
MSKTLSTFGVTVAALVTALSFAAAVSGPAATADGTPPPPTTTTTDAPNGGGNPWHD